MLEYDRIDVSEELGVTKLMVCVKVFIITGTFLAKILDLIQKYIIVPMTDVRSYEFS